VIDDADAEQPIHAFVTAANVNDITVAKKMPIKAGATYVFDLGSCDYGWRAAPDAAGCRIVTRFKSNTPVKESVERAVAEDSTVLSDRIGRLPQRQARSRKNPFSRPVREVRVETDTGKLLRILSNDLDAPAQDIAEPCKRRWAIEVFFRWIEQTLKIRHFLGVSENAALIQVAIAPIAYLLQHLAKAAQTTVKSPLDSHASCAQTSCTESASTASSGPIPHPQNAANKSPCNGPWHEPDSSGPESGHPCSRPARQDSGMSNVPTGYEHDDGRRAGTATTIRPRRPFRVPGSGNSP